MRRLRQHFTIMPSDLDAVTRSRGWPILRLHGRDAQAYLRGKTVAERFYYDYSDEEIGEVARAGEEARARGRHGARVFNNNALDFAPHAALAPARGARADRERPPRQADLFR